jgi:hypothetical protein
MANDNINVDIFICNNARFNQSLPGNKMVMFAHNIISAELGNRNMAISPKGDVMGHHIVIKKVNRKWPAPAKNPGTIIHLTSLDYCYYILLIKNISSLPVTGIQLKHLLKKSKELLKT